MFVGNTSAMYVSPTVRYIKIIFHLCTWTDILTPGWRRALFFLNLTLNLTRRLTVTWSIDSSVLVSFSRFEFVSLRNFEENNWRSHFVTDCECIRVFRPEPYSVRSANFVLNVYQKLSINLKQVIWILNINHFTQNIITYIKIIVIIFAY